MSFMERRRQIKNIMVWSGMHGQTGRGGEGGFGFEVEDSLRHYPIPGVEVGFANPGAVETRQRFIDKNLALRLNVPKLDPTIYYEDTLVPEIKKRSEDKDLVIDLHSHLLHEGTFAYVGPQVDPHVLDFIGKLGIENVIVTDSGIQGILPQAVLLDYSHNTSEHVLYFRSQLTAALENGLEEPSSFRRFKFYAHADLTTDEIDKLGLSPENHGRRYFRSLKDEVPGAAEIFAVDRKVIALFPAGDEVVAELNTEDLSVVHGKLQLPTLRSLGNAA
jgi:hypothetical protein